MSLDHWYFSKNILCNSPSRKHGVNEEKEQAYLQQTANLIQEMGRKLSLPLLCINTAVLFTQRFYVFHSITSFEKFSVGASALFLAAKVEEQPRKVEHVCQIAKILGIVKKGVKDTEYCQELILNENILLQTLGFEVQVQHPHQHVLRLCNLLKASKNLSQTSYIFATYCLHLTRMCLVHKPVNIACLCIYMACKHIKWEFPLSREDKHWFTYGDSALTEDILETMRNEFLNVFKQCPENCKRKTLTTSHENMLKKLSVHTTGLPIVKEVDQTTVNPTSSSSISPTAAESLEISNKIFNMISKDTPSVVRPTNLTHKFKPKTETNTLDPSKIAHSNPLNKPIPSSSINTTSAFNSSTIKTDSNLIKPMQNRLSQSTSLLPKPTSVPPLKISQLQLQKSASCSNGSLATPQTVPSLKITIPRSRLPHLDDSIMSDHRPAAIADVKTEKMAFSLTPASMGEHNSSKKFKPN